MESTSKTDRADESRWSEFWETENIYGYAPTLEKPRFSIDTPPPTVSGSIHIGHVFSYTQAEVIARFKRMQGFNVFYPFGFDDNGLPTERLVEKELEVKGSTMDSGDFTAKCYEITAASRLKMRQLWKSLGLSVDWNLEYSTISPEVQRISQRSFIELLEKGRIQRKESPALWCPECQTSLAQADVEDKDLDSQFHKIRFRLEDGKEIVIATTRPELLRACVGVFVHPEDERYKDIIGKTITTPLGDNVRIIADDKVSITKGTGVVMCCSYGDETDLYWIKKHKLEEKIIIGKDGKMDALDDHGETRKVPIKAKRKEVLQRLREQGDIIQSENIKHSVGVHERCDTPVEILPVNQWFIEILDLKEKLIAAADQIKWHPEYMKTRYVQWVSGLNWDWCVSRQRFYGVPLPVWISKKNGEIILPGKDQLPVDPRVDMPAVLPAGHSSEDIIGESDVLDTWATSSLTPQINGKWGEKGDRMPEIFPMDLRPQAHDIIRTWLLYTVIQSDLHHGELPWGDVMISGHVQKKKGEKISKSRDHKAMSPEELIAKYSADAVRYWACGARTGTDVVFDEKEIVNGKRLVIKMLNAGKLIVKNLDGFNPKENLDENELSDIDKWILARVQETAAIMRRHLEDYEVGLARSEFEKFFWNDYCGNYLEIVKGRLYGNLDTADDVAKNGRISAQYTLYKSFLAVIKLIAPYLPFITEEIYQGYFREFEGEKSLHITEQSREEAHLDPEIGERMVIFTDILDHVRRFKAQNSMGAGKEIEAIVFEGTRRQIASISPVLRDLLGVTKAKKFNAKETEEVFAKPTIACVKE
jgi:valyl-tRNA synthetase